MLCAGIEPHRVGSHSGLVTSDHVQAAEASQGHMTPVGLRACYPKAEIEFAQGLPEPCDSVGRRCPSWVLSRRMKGQMKGAQESRGSLKFGVLGFDPLGYASGGRKEELPFTEHTACPASWAGHFSVLSPSSLSGWCPCSLFPAGLTQGLLDP